MAVSFFICAKRVIMKALGITILENNMQVNKIYTAHFYLKIKPNQPLNIYGVKTEDEIYEIGRELINSGLFAKAYYTVSWKETKKSRWEIEEYIFIKEKLNAETKPSI